LAYLSAWLGFQEVKDAESASNEESVAIKVVQLATIVRGGTGLVLDMAQI
jgi:hypothetical protein